MTLHCLLDLMNTFRSAAAVPDWVIANMPRPEHTEQFRVQARGCHGRHLACGTLHCHIWVLRPSGSDCSASTLKKRWHKNCPENEDAKCGGQTRNKPLLMEFQVRLFAEPCQEVCPKTISSEICTRISRAYLCMCIHMGIYLNVCICLYYIYIYTHI